MAMSTEGVLEWRPIEEAPKDGTWVLVWGRVCHQFCEYGDERGAAVAQYTNDLNGGKTDWHWQFAWFDGGYYGRVDKVTHFMPLPAPPALNPEVKKG